MAIEIRTLENVPAEELRESHNRAFGDYAVPFQLSMRDFLVVQRQNGVRLDASFGAFDGSQLIGIWLNGLRDVDGVPHAYDAGTAIWSEYRGKGLSSRLAQASDRHLRDLGVRRYRLEVLTSNQRAFRVYEKAGFGVRRMLVCLMKKRVPGEAAGAGDSIVVEDAPLGAATPGLPAMEHEPSWQNSWDAMRAIAEDIRIVTARDGDRVVGYGLAKGTRGTITQIGVLPGYWEHPAATRLVERLVGLAEGDVARILNIDERAENTLSLFARCGFEPMVTQHEMEKALDGTAA